MATINRSVNQATATQTAQVARNGRQEVFIDNTIDFGATGNTYSVADVFNVLTVPAGYSLTAAGVEVLKADTAGNSGTLALKLGATALGSAATVAATGFNSTIASLTPQAPSGSNAFITLTTATGLVNAVVRVYAIISDLRYIPGSPVITGTTTTPAGATSVLGVDPVANYNLTFVV